MNMRSFILILLFLFQQHSHAGFFGPREHAVMFDGRKSLATYHIDNTDDKNPWLVQAWIEDANENRTNAFIIAPDVFRVEPSSAFNVRILKKEALPTEHETLFWVVSHSLPNGNKNDNKVVDNNKITAELNLAYRFKTPMIYRPAAIADSQPKPQLLQWSTGKEGKIQVYNPTPYIFHLKHVYINSKMHKGKGVSFLILPKKKHLLNIQVKNGGVFKYGVENDFGAVKEYEGTIL
ncbi:fimbrial biogenesis chaperone [Escherichia marmotae]|uniref:fimbrial biogenesis chaperone n=1 Tax=Escherichia marmotae TaxID=1499973 RepID=UPI002001A913|nr:molecular chaperone [Escherichia marmotae]